MHPAINRYIEAAVQSGLVSNDQLDRATRRVSRIARDMPPSDAVWIEALRAEGMLNRRQVETLGDRSIEPGLVFNGLILIDTLSPVGHAWRALHQHSGRYVVVKRLDRERPHNWKTIRSAHLVHAHRFLARANHHWVVNEFVEGAGLDALTSHYGPLPPDCVVEIARQAAAALAELHKHAVSHERLCPEHVLVGVDGVVKLADYGLGPHRPSAGMSTAGAWNPRVTDIRQLADVITAALTGRAAGKGAGLVVTGRSGKDVLPATTPGRLVQLLDRLHRADGSFSIGAVVKALGPSTPDARARLAEFARQFARADRPRRAGRRTRYRAALAGLAAAVGGLAVAAWLLGLPGTARQPVKTTTHSTLALPAASGASGPGRTEEGPSSPESKPPVRAESTENRLRR